MSLQTLMTYDYRIEPFQVTGPEWTNVDRFDIEARFSEGADKNDERKMLQALLKDRFKLAFHVEKKELDAYVLVADKHGAKLKPSPPDPVAPEATAPVKPGEAAAPKSAVTKNADGSNTIDMGKKGTWTINFDREDWANVFTFSKMTMADLAERLRNCLGNGVQHVEDQTGIQGNYQVKFECPLPGAPPVRSGAATAGTPSDPQGNYPLTRSLAALGLKVEKRKILMDLYVIDHAEKPSAN